MKALIRSFFFLCSCALAVSLSAPSDASDVMELAERLEVKAIRGDVRAAYKLGLLFSDGKKIAPDRFTANEWYRKSAEGGYRKAMEKLAAYHLRAGNLDQATDWYYKAAETGSVASMVKLADLYHARKNDDNALMWYKRAALRKHPVAMREVGASYFKSAGVRFDLQRAYAWFFLAAQKGDRKAGNFLQQIEATKGPTWVAQMKQAIEYRQLPPDYWNAN